MKSRRDFMNFVYAAVAAMFASIATACGSKPDAETEPSPEWPPKD